MSDLLLAIQTADLDCQMASTVGTHANGRKGDRPRDAAVVANLQTEPQPPSSGTGGLHTPGHGRLGRGPLETPGPDLLQC